MKNAKLKVYTVNETAQRLRIRLESVYRLIYAGLIAGERVDGKWKISATSVENYANRRSLRGAHLRARLRTDSNAGGIVAVEA